MTYNDMPVIIPLLATGYLLTIYLLLILAQRTIKSSRYVADSLTDAYASYVPTEQATHSDGVEQWSRTLQRSPSGRWTKSEPSSSASSLGVTAITPPLRESPFHGKAFAQPETGNVDASEVANTSLTPTENFTLQAGEMSNGSTEQERLQGTVHANPQENNGTSLSKIITPEL